MHLIEMMTWYGSAPAMSETLIMGVSSLQCCLETGVASYPVLLLSPHQGKRPRGGQLVTHALFPEAGSALTPHLSPRR